MLGGSIQLKSNEGKGAVFTLFLQQNLSGGQVIKKHIEEIKKEPLNLTENKLSGSIDLSEENRIKDDRNNSKQ